MAKKINFVFEDLPYQTKAVNSVVELLEGLDRKAVNAVYDYGQISYRDPKANAEFTVGRRLKENLNRIQYANGLFKDDSIVGDIPQFTIEMETGTGKTFVYLKTILSLWKTYGEQFKKYIIVVPTTPILLGVKKSINMLAPYFQREFNIDISVSGDINKRSGMSFVFDTNCSENDVLSKFIESENLSIMLIAYQSFNKESNRLRKATEKTNSLVVWDEIKKIKPIVIIDEPQKIDGTKKKKSASLQALEDLKPLMILRYSATHKNLYNQVYKFNSYDAYKEHSVKGITVRTLHGLTPKNYPYVRYLGMTKDLKGRIEIFTNKEHYVSLSKFNVELHASLEELSGGLSQYKGWYIDKQPRKNEPLTITCNGAAILELEKGKSNDEIRPEDTIEKMIEIAIRAHIDKQMELLNAGKKIKALTLFFVDSVAKVRGDSPDGRGEYLKIFDRVFEKIRREPQYRENLFRFRDELTYLDVSFPVNEIREGYFAIDKNKKAIEIEKWDSNVNDEDISFNAKTQENIDRGIDLILNKKDELISFDTKLCFIFSHSALREGWDNPNVFTLVTLKEGSSEISKKQEIGRGLRLPVDVYGNRCYDEKLNELTVVANDYYDDFAEALQKDINESIGIDGNEITADVIKNTIIRAGIPEEKIEAACDAFKKELIEKGLVSIKGNKLIIKDKTDLSSVIFTNPVLCEHAAKISEVFVKVMIEKGSARVGVKNGDEPQIINEFQKYITETQFSNMYKSLLKILQKRSVYRYSIDKDKFISDVVDSLEKLLMQKNNKTTFIETIIKVEADNKKNELHVVKDSSNEHEGSEIKYQHRSDFELALCIMNKTILPRLIVLKILNSLNWEARNRINNQDYLDESIKLIEKKLEFYRGQNMLEAELIAGETATEAEIFAVDNITREDIEDSSKNIFKPNPYYKKALNTIYKFDSKGELEFAKRLDTDRNVLLYTKLKKGGFVIETPAGNYSPDWAIVYRKDNEQLCMYFIAETKWDKEYGDLRDEEKIKISCAKNHFKAVNKAFAETIKYAWVNSYKDTTKEASFPQVFDK